METDQHRGQVPARIEPSAQPRPWKSSEISRMVTTPMIREQAAQLVTRLLGSYPSLNLHDPETYIASVTALLCGYAFWVGDKAIEKVSRESKFVPTKAELTEACDHFAPSRVVTWADEWDRRSAAQLAEREQLKMLPPPKQTIEEFHAEMRARGLPIGGKSAAHTETAESVRAKLGLSQAQWDAIPDAPPPGAWQRLADAAAAAVRQSEAAE